MEGKRMPFGRLEIDLQTKTNLCLDQAFFFLPLPYSNTENKGIIQDENLTSTCC